MADKKMYKVGITVKEPWSADISYEVLDITLYAVENGGDGCSYIAIRANQGVTPGTDDTVWVKATQRGQSIYDLAVKYGDFEGTEAEFEAEYEAAVHAAQSAAQSASYIEAQVETNEAARVTAERARSDAETARSSAETARINAENARNDAESLRDTAESDRVRAEAGRVTAEASRVEAETFRQGAEQSRRQQFEGLKTDMETAIDNVDAKSAEIAEDIEGYEANEAGRVSAENARATAESARVSAETARESQAASDHTQAASDHTRAENDHTRAESDHTRAEEAAAAAEHMVDIKQGPQGPQGNTGSSVDYPYELVNNLTTDDATKGLSAAQGVVLDRKVSQLEQEVDELDINFGEPEVVSKNILTPSMILARTGYLRKDNGNPTNGFFGYTDYFELGEKGLSCNNAVGVSGAYGCPAVLYDANKVFVRYSALPGISSVANKDIKYVRFNLGDPNLLPDGEDYAVYNTLYIPGYDEYKVGRKIGKNKIEKSMLQDDAVPANSLVKTETSVSPNLFNKEYRRTNTFINAANGIVYVSNDSFSSDYIEIPSGASSLYITNVRFYGVSGWAAYDSSFNYTHGSQGNKLVTIREGDAYIRFCAYNEDLDIVMVVVGTSANVPAEYAPYGIIERYSLKQDTVGIDELKNKSVTEEKLAVKKVDVKIGKNKCDPQDPDFKLNYQISSADGTEYEWTGSNVGRVGCTGYIPVSGNGLILNHYVEIGASSGMAVYDVNKVYIRGARTGIYSYQPGDAYVRFTFNYAYKDEIQVEEGAEITPYQPFSPIAGYGVVLEGNVPSLVSEQLAYNLKIQLPNVIYAVVGTQLYLWNDAISYSIDRGLNSPMNYSVYWYSGNIGVITERGFKYTPEDSHAGHSYTVRCDLYSVTGVLVSQKSFTIKVLAKNALASAKKIVFFGDSTGAPTATNMYNDFHNSEKFTGVAPTMLGSRGGSTIRYDAVGGYAWADYATQGRAAFRCFVTNAPTIPLNAKYTNNGFTWEVVEVNVTNGVGNILITRDSTTYTDTPSASGVLVAVSSGVSDIPYDSYENAPANPLWDSNSNSLSIAHYKDIVGISQTDHFDAVSFLLGLNGNPTPEQTTAYIKSLYNVFVEDNPDCLFLLALVTSCGNTQDGFGASFGASINSITNMKKTFALRELYLQLRDDPELPNLRIVPAHTELDRYYGYGFSARQISQRYTENEQYHDNAVHPASSGFGQLGDCFFAAFIGALTEE